MLHLSDSFCWVQVLDVDQNGKPAAVEPEEEEDGIDTLVCSVLSTLQNLGRHLEITKKVELSNLTIT